MALALAVCEERERVNQRQSAREHLEIRGAVNALKSRSEVIRHVGPLSSLPEVERLMSVFPTTYKYPSSTKTGSAVPFSAASLHGIIDGDSGPFGAVIQSGACHEHPFANVLRLTRRSGPPRSTDNAACCFRDRRRRRTTGLFRLWRPARSGRLRGLDKAVRHVASADKRETPRGNGLRCAHATRRHVAARRGRRRPQAGMADRACGHGADMRSRADGVGSRKRTETASRRRL